MALTKKLSLLCMSILTLNFISSDNLYAGDYDSVDYYNDYNNYFYVDSTEYKDILYLYQHKSKNNYYELDDREKLEDTSSFINDVKSILNSNVLRNRDSNSFFGRVQNIMNQFNIKVEDITNKNKFGEKLQYKLDKYSESILNDFISGKQYSESFITSLLLSESNSESNVSNIITKLILLELDVNKKFNLLLSLCEKYNDKYNDKYNNNANINLDDILQTLFCMISYDINMKSGKHDDIAAKLLQLIISYKKTKDLDEDIKQTLNDNLLKYIKNAYGNISDNLIQNNVSESLILLFRNYLFKNDNDYTNNNDDDYIFNFGSYNNKKRFTAQYEPEIKNEVDLLSEENTKNFSDLRNTVIVQHCLLNKTQHFTQNIPSFSGNEQKDNKIKSYNIPYLKNYVRSVLQQQYNNRKLGNHKDRKTEYIKQLLTSTDSLNRIISLTLRPEKLTSDETVRYKDITDIFYKNPPRNIKFATKKNSVPVVTFNGISSLMSIFNINKNGDIGIALDENLENLLSRFEETYGDKKIVSELCCLLYDKIIEFTNKDYLLITVQDRRNIVKSVLEHYIIGENNKTNILKTFTEYLSVGECNVIIKTLLGYACNNRIGEQYEKQYCVRFIKNMILNQLLTCKESLVHQAIEYIKKSALMNNDKNKNGIYKIVDNLLEEVNKLIKIKINSYKQTDSNIIDYIKLFIDCNNLTVEKWFNKYGSNNNTLDAFLENRSKENIASKKSFEFVREKLKISRKQVFADRIINNLILQGKNSYNIADNEGIIYWSKLVRTSNNYKIDNTITLIEKMLKLNGIYSINKKYVNHIDNCLKDDLLNKKYQSLLKKIVDNYCAGDVLVEENNSKELLAKDIIKFVKSINGYDVLQHSMFPDISVFQKAVKLLANFIVNQDTEVCKNYVSKLSIMHFLLLIKTIANYQIANNEQNNLYLISPQEFISYIFRSKIMDEYFKNIIKGDNKSIINTYQVISDLRKKITIRNEELSINILNWCFDNNTNGVLIKSAEHSDIIGTILNESEIVNIGGDPNEIIDESDAGELGEFLRDIPPITMGANPPREAGAGAQQPREAGAGRRNPTRGAGDDRRNPIRGAGAGDDGRVVGVDILSDIDENESIA